MSIGVLSDELKDNNDEREHDAINAKWTERVLFAEIFHHKINCDETGNKGDRIG